MKIKVQKNIKHKKGILVIPLFTKHNKKLPSNLAPELKSFIEDRIKNLDIDLKKESFLHSFIDLKNHPNQILLASLGEKDSFSSKKARTFGGKLVKKIKSLQAEEIVFFESDKVFSDHSQSFFEGFLIGRYSFKKFKTKEDNKKEITVFSFITSSKDSSLKDSIQKADIIASSAELVKNLVNSPSNEVHAKTFEKEAKKIAKANKYKVAVLNEKDLKKMKWGGILAVNQGSHNEAKVVVLEYNGATNKKEAPIVLVGKGIMFDAGGYNIKRTGAIELMHQDMAGAATILGVFDALKALNIKKNVVGILPMAENLINQKAYRPSDIITMLSGNTVEITNTDAEGRLILADSIHYGRKYKPELILTIATLTGASSVATGNRYASIFSNSESMLEKLKEAGAAVDDPGWPLPIHEDYKKKMDSEIADFRNYDKGTGGIAGSSKAAAFLEKFVGKHDWVHIDIGGTAFTNDPRPFEVKGATAHGLRMILKFIERIA